MADFFDIDFGIQTENLMNPLHADQTNLDFIGSIASNLQHIRDQLLGDYRLGSSYPAYSGATNYVRNNKVIYTDKCIYEAKKSTIGVPPTGNVASSETWRKVQDTFVGSYERTNYTGQLIKMSYGINKWYGCSAPSLIYFVPNLSAGLGYELYVPSALYATLGATNTDRDNNLNAFLVKYTVGGTTNAIFTY